MFSKLKTNKIVNYIFLIILIVLLCLQQWKTFSKHFEKFEHPINYTSENYNNDFITKYGNRFQEAKIYLKNPTHIGYYSEVNQDIPTFYLHYVLTQYYLAPNLISKNLNSDTVLYNLYNSQQIDASLNYHLKNGWHELKNFNNGLIILSK